MTLFSHLSRTGRLPPDGGASRAYGQDALSQNAPGRYALVHLAGSRNAPPVADPIHEDADRASRAFGLRVRKLRVREGLSQDGLAHTSGIHFTSIGRIEWGGREPRLTTIQSHRRRIGPWGGLRARSTRVSTPDNGLRRAACLGERAVFLTTSVIKPRASRPFSRRDRLPRVCRDPTYHH